MLKPDAASDEGRTREPRPDAPGDDERSSTQGVLAHLIEVERGVDEAVRQAEAEASCAIAAAKSEIAERQQEHDHTLAAALRELEARLEAERSEALAEIDRRSAESARKYSSVDEASVQALAESVAVRVAESDLEDSEPEP